MTFSSFITNTKLKQSKLSELKSFHVLYRLFALFYKISIVLIR